MISLVVKTASAGSFWRCGRMFSAVAETVEVDDATALVLLSEPMLRVEEAKAEPKSEAKSEEAKAEPKRR